MYFFLFQFTTELQYEALAVADNVRVAAFCGGVGVVRWDLPQIDSNTLLAAFSFILNFKKNDKIRTCVDA